MRARGTVVPCAYDGMEFDPVVDAQLALRPITYAKPWNGWAVPVVAANEYARFVDAWARNDPNGIWGSVIEGDDLDGQRYLLHVSSEAGMDGLGLDAEKDGGRRHLQLGTIYRLQLDRLDYGVDYWPAGEGSLYALDGHTFRRL